MGVCLWVVFVVCFHIAAAGCRGLRDASFHLLVMSDVPERAFDLPGPSCQTRLIISRPNGDGGFVSAHQARERLHGEEAEGEQRKGA